MASSSSKRKHAGSHEEAAELFKNALMFMKMAKDDVVNSKFFIDQATMAICSLQSLRTSTKQDKVTRDQITRDYYKCSKKRENGCPAKKHMQQVNSHEYRVVYFRSHTCGGIQNHHHQQQQQHSPPLDPSKHGSATVQIPNSSSSIPATSSPEPAGQNNEDDEYLHAILEQFVSSGEEIDLDSVLRRT